MSIRDHMKIMTLERMQYLLSQLQSLDESGIAELVSIMDPKPYPGINVALDQEREQVIAELQRRGKPVPWTKVTR